MANPPKKNKPLPVAPPVPTIRKPFVPQYYGPSNPNYGKKLPEDALWRTRREHYRWKPVDDVPQLQIELLEEQCKLWEYTLDRHYAMKEGRLDDMVKIAEAERPIREKARCLQFLEGIARKIIMWPKVAEDPRLIESEKQKSAADIMYWLTYYCYTYDPRLPEIGLTAKTAFVPFEQQKVVLASMQSWYENRQNGLIDKSREMGVSWLAMAFVTHQFQFGKGFSAILASEKEEKVDIIGSMKPLFGKIRYMIYNQPEFMRPTSYEKEGGPNDNFRRLINPANGSEITGEAGVNIGRSGRCSVFILDEAQEIEQPERVDSALESVTNCRIDIGTPNGMNHFGKRRFSGKVLHETIHWYQDPRKNPLWREDKPNYTCPWRLFIEARTPDSVIIAQEYDLDYNASVMGAIIPSEWVLAAVEWLDAPEDGDKVAGFDVAGGGKNESIYIERIGSVALRPVVSSYKTTIEAAWDAIDKGEKDGIGAINYDGDGLGESLMGLFTNSERRIAFKVTDVHGNARASERVAEGETKKGFEKFRNKRAEVWWGLRKRFEKAYEHKKKLRLYPAREMISIPNDPVLITQLSQPKQVLTPGGKIGVEGKDSMRTRGVDSPDRADALAYAFWDIDEGERLMSAFNYTTQKQHYEDFKIDIENWIGNQYVSIVQTPDMVTSALCCLWDNRPSQKKLKIYGEFVEPSAIPAELIEKIKMKMSPDLLSIKEWIGNDELFRGILEGKQAIWNLYRKAGVNLRQNMTTDYRGAIALTNIMFSKDMVVVHKEVKGLMMQLANWHNRKGQPEENLGLAMCLCQLVTRLKIKKEIQPETMKLKAYNKADKVSVI
jgi:hypothetical protein